MYSPLSGIAREFIMNVNINRSSSPVARSTVSHAQSWLPMQNVPSHPTHETSICHAPLHKGPPLTCLSGSCWRAVTSLGDEHPL